MQSKHQGSATVLSPFPLTNPSCAYTFLRSDTLVSSLQENIFAPQSPLEVLQIDDVSFGSRCDLLITVFSIPIDLYSPNSWGECLLP